MPTNPNPVPWPDSNWVWHLFKGLTDQDLLRILENYQTNNKDTSTRLAYNVMIFFEAMAIRCLNERQGIPPPPSIDDPWPDNNWVWQLFRGMTNEDLTDIITMCRRPDINEAGRTVYTFLKLFNAMSASVAQERGLI